MTVQTDGYLIVLRPKKVFQAYKETEFFKNNEQRLDQLWSTFSNINSQNYRGIDRKPLEPIFDKKYLEPSDQAPNDKEGSELKARLKMGEFIRKNRRAEMDSDEDLLEEHDLAVEVYKALDDKSHYEIIRISRVPLTRTSETIGYDIGYWGGDHFSIIKDSLVMPRWHPPDPNDYLKLQKYVNRLNDSVLFSSQTYADNYRSFYRSLPWAEEELYGPEDEIFGDGEFCIIRVEKINH